jgi:hypothetical protein
MSKTADALPDNADQDTFSTVPIPLRERRRDWFFVAMFAIFASTSFLTDPVTLLDRPDPNSRWFMSRFIYHSGTYSLILVDPRFVQVTARVDWTENRSLPAAAGGWEVSCRTSAVREAADARNGRPRGWCHDSPATACRQAQPDAQCRSDLPRTHGPSRCRRTYQRPLKHRRPLRRPRSDCGSAFPSG